jgi:RNA polymerase sigma-70 factor (ECF subfamily)
VTNRSGFEEGRIMSALQAVAAQPLRFPRPGRINVVEFRCYRHGMGSRVPSPNGARSADDADLLGRVAQGDERALRALYENHERRLFAFLNAMMRDSFAAADILNETMLEVWRSAGDFEGRSKVSTWIFGIARLKALARMRKDSRETPAPPDVDRPDPSADAFALLSASEDASAVRHCIEQLTSAHRAVVHFVFYEEMGYSEVAEIMGCPENTVKTRVFHAKRLLQHCLERRLAEARGR